MTVVNQPEPTIVCPSCKTRIRLTDTLAAPLIEATRQEFQKKLETQTSDIARREAAVRADQARIKKTQAAIQTEIETRLLAERQRIAADETRKARLLISAELDDKIGQIASLNEVIASRDEKLQEARQGQLELLRKQRELEDARRELELTVESRVSKSLHDVRAGAKREAEEALRFTIADRDQQIASMKSTIEELKRKSDQGSQQLQGEVFELELETLLRTKFPRDTVEPVPKGVCGGDVLQHVFGPSGQPCGTILWETKRTKNWSDSWLAKLRNDQREAKADVVLIVSQALPKGLDAFDLIDGVWVTDFRCVVPVAVSVRHCLIEVASARLAGQGRQTKMQMVYSYLTGPRFRQRIEAMVEKITEMQTDLDREKAAMNRLQSAIKRYLEEYNDDPKPFVWTKSADAILQKLAKIPEASV